MTTSAKDIREIYRGTIRMKIHISLELLITPPPFNVAGQILDIFGLPRYPNKGGGVIPAPPGSLRRAGRSSQFEFLASQKSSFSTGFIRFFDMAECHVTFTENPNAFLYFWVPFYDFGSKSPKFHRIYKVFWHTFMNDPKRCFTHAF